MYKLIWNANPNAYFQFSGLFVIVCVYLLLSFNTALAVGEQIDIWNVVIIHFF